MKAKCPVCGKKFEKRIHNHIFCSRKCGKADWFQRHSEPTTDKCKCGCGGIVSKKGNLYITGHNLRDSNLTKDYTKILKPRICELCKSIYMPTGLSQKFCVSCKSSIRLKRCYDITLDEFDRMKSKQGNMCAICGSLFSDTNIPQIDHSHTTNNVRGLLCGNCNKALGSFKDDITILSKAIKYLS